MLVRSSQSTLLNRSEQNRSQHNWTQHNTNSRVTLIGSPWRGHLCPHPLTKLMTGLYRCSLLYFTPLHSTLLCPTELQYVVFPLVSWMTVETVSYWGLKTLMDECMYCAVPCTVLFSIELFRKSYHFRMWIYVLGVLNYWHQSFDVYYMEWVPGSASFI